MNFPKRILKIVSKNTSELDFSAPLLWKIKKTHPKTEIEVLFYNSSKEQYLRDATFYKELFSQSGIKVTDLLDYSYIPRFLHPIIRKIINVSSADRKTLKIILHDLKLSGGKHFFDSLKEILLNFRILVQRICGLLVDYGSLMDRINPDIILLGNRYKKDYFGLEKVYDYFYRTKKPVILTPHSTHEVHEYTEFTPFELNGRSPLADFNDYWISFKYENTWKSLPHMKNNFAYVGYPGADVDWFNFLTEFNKKFFKQKIKPHNLTIGLILRKFLPEGMPRPHNFDAFTLNYDEMLDLLNKIASSINKAEVNYTLEIKPHPSNNMSSLKEILNKTELKNWRITPEPIYALLNSTDIFISLFSTVKIIPALNKTPVVIIDSNLQKYVNQKWDVLGSMYKSFPFYIYEIKHITKILNDMVGTATASEKFYNKMREHYPDHSSEKCMDRIKFLFSKHQPHYKDNRVHQISNP